jgi:DNA-binding NtrC family response regulator
LRERRGDIAVLAAHFARRVAGLGPPPDDVVTALTARAWPGNVRELDTFVTRAGVAGWHGALALDDAGPATESVRPSPPSSPPVVDRPLPPAHRRQPSPSRRMRLNRSTRRSRA